MNATPPQSAVKPAAVIFDSAARRTPRPFGRGILASLPAVAVDYSAEDARWWAEESARLEEARLESGSSDYLNACRHADGYASC